MRTLFAGPVHVHYGQFYVESSEDGVGDAVDCRAGQANGLCGAAVSGLLFLVTGLHTGNVPVVVEAHDGPPPIGPDWEEVVEVSFRPVTPVTRLVEWGGEAWPLPLGAIDHRVRYCISGMDEGRAADTRMDGEPVLDRCLLQFWPAPPAPDRVVRQASETAAYRHEAARREPTRSARAAARPAEPAAIDRPWPAFEADFRLQQQQLWGGRLPSERVLAVGEALGLGTLDRELVDRLDEVDAGTLRRVAAWAARRAYAEAGLADRPWAAPALAALDRGDPLPPPFDDRAKAWNAMEADHGVPSTTVASPGGVTNHVPQQTVAFHALPVAAGSDPLAAAIGALHHAGQAFGHDHPQLMADVRAAFPVLAVRRA